jgi:5-methylcytosine-specific restriction endonuclease McrA
MDELAEAFGDGHIHINEFRTQVHLLSERQRLLDAGLPTDRPPRTMPSMKSILRYLDFPAGECWKCGGDFDYLERAHVIDRCGDGLDVEPNLRPLCVTCHRLQPMFVNGQEAEAAQWFNRRRSALLDVMETR